MIGIKNNMNPSPKMRGFLFDLFKYWMYICKGFEREAFVAQLVSSGGLINRRSLVRTQADAQNVLYLMAE